MGAAVMGRADACRAARPVRVAALVMIARCVAQVRAVAAHLTRD
jgi:hypothetical protein